MNHTAKHIIITGKVQGVFFRKYTKQQADGLRLTGWVRNTHDGKVKIFVQGDENSIEAFAQWCHRGSPRAHVETVDITAAAPDVNCKQFLIDR